MTHICVDNLTIIGPDNGLSPGRRQAIIWTNAGIMLIGPLGTNFSEILIEIRTFSFKKMRLKLSSGKWRPFCLSLNVVKKKCVKLTICHIASDDGLVPNWWPIMWTNDGLVYWHICIGWPQWINAKELLLQCMAQWSFALSHGIWRAHQNGCCHR